MTADVLILTSYFGERQRVTGGYFADAQMAAFDRNQIVSSILLRGVSGFGMKHHFRSNQPLTLSEDLPLVSIAVDSRRKVECVAEELYALGHRGLVTLERAQMLDGLPATTLDPTHEAVKLTVHIGRGERTYRVPAYIAVCDLLHRRGMDTATVLLGVDGTRDGHRARGRFLGRNDDVPTMIIAIGSGQRIGRVLSELGGLLRDPRVVIERVRLCKADGQLLDHPGAGVQVDGRGVPMWHKLTVYTSASVRFEGEPIHRALVRRLRAGDARGATVLGGIWGFHRDRRPAGDSLWRLGRGVPMCTVVIDTPQRLARAFEAVDEVTSEHGLVTAEIVPALVASAGGPARPPTLAGHSSDTRPVRGRSIARWGTGRSGNRNSMR